MSGRALRRRQGVLFDAVTTVPELAGCQLRVREVNAAVEEVYGERVPLSTHGTGSDPRFRRVRYGVYEMARSSDGGGWGSLSLERVRRGFLWVALARASPRVGEVLATVKHAHKAPNVDCVASRSAGEALDPIVVLGCHDV